MGTRHETTPRYICDTVGTLLWGLEDTIRAVYAVNTVGTMYSMVSHGMLCAVNTVGTIEDVRRRCQLLYTQHCHIML